MNEADNIAEEYYSNKYEEYENPKKEYYEETEKCQGDMCIEDSEDDGTHLCSKCQKYVQRSFEEFCTQFTKAELEYLKFYIKEKEREVE